MDLRRNGPGGRAARLQETRSSGSKRSYRAETGSPRAGQGTRSARDEKQLAQFSMSYESPALDLIPAISPGNVALRPRA